MKVKQKLIDKYIERIKADYPEDDKLMMDLESFAEEVVKLLCKRCYGTGTYMDTHPERYGPVRCGCKAN